MYYSKSVNVYWSMSRTFARRFIYIPVLVHCMSPNIIVFLLLLKVLKNEVVNTVASTPDS